MFIIFTNLQFSSISGRNAIFLEMSPMLLQQTRSNIQEALNCYIFPSNPQSPQFRKKMPSNNKLKATPTLSQDIYFTTQNPKLTPLILFMIGQKSRGMFFCKNKVLTFNFSRRAASVVLGEFPRLFQLSGKCVRFVDEADLIVHCTLNIL